MYALEAIALYRKVWDVLDVTIEMYGQPKQEGAVATAYCCEHYQSIQLSDCTWCLRTGFGNTASREGSN